jgi:hypothetical protein
MILEAGKKRKKALDDIVTGHRKTWWRSTAAWCCWWPRILLHPVLCGLMIIFPSVFFKSFPSLCFEFLFDSFFFFLLFLFLFSPKIVK